MQFGAELAGASLALSVERLRRRLSGGTRKRLRGAELHRGLDLRRYGLQFGAELAGASLSLSAERLRRMPRRNAARHVPRHVLSVVVSDQHRQVAKWCLAGGFSWAPVCTPNDETPTS